MDKNLMTVGSIVLAVLTLVSRISLFHKAGRSGWLAIIPVVSSFTEFSICWNGGMALLQFVLAGIISFAVSVGTQTAMVVAGVTSSLLLLIHLVENVKLARSFGHGGFYGLLLFFFPQLGRIVLGLGGSRYFGRNGSRKLSAA